MFSISIFEELGHVAFSKLFSLGQRGIRGLSESTISKGAVEGEQWCYWQ